MINEEIACHHETELKKREAQRDLGAELLESVRPMAARKGRVVTSSVISARKKLGLPQTEFAKLPSVSVRTLQDWKQGQRQHSGAAKTLIAISERRPEVLREASSVVTKVATKQSPAKVDL